jgi:predicted TIM-barrel fold metal-dependent hydrolase
MKSFEHEVPGNTRDDIRPRPAGLSRRELFLKGGVAIAVTQALGAEANAADATRKIALEEHFTTAELAKSYVARPTRSDTLFADIERRLADFDQLRLETMDKAGIDLAVLSVTTPGVQAEKDTNTAIKLAREANDLLAREVQKRPQRYAGFAHLPTQDGGAAAAELERAVKDLRFKGALINGQTNGKYLDANMYLPFWERVQDLDVPIYLHPGELADHPAMFAGRPELNGPVWAWTADTGAHALRLVFAGTFTNGTWQTLTTTFGFAASRFALSITSSSANRNRVRRIQGDCHPSKRRALYCETARKARTFTSVRDASGNRGRGSRGTHANDLPISTRHGFRHDADPGSRP